MKNFSLHLTGCISVLASVSLLFAAHYTQPYPPEAALLIFPCALAYIVLGCFSWRESVKYVAFMWVGLAIELTVWFVVGMRVAGLQNYYGDWMYFQNELGIYFVLALFWSSAFALGGLFGLVRRKIRSSRRVSGQ